MAERTRAEGGALDATIAAPSVEPTGPAASSPATSSGVRERLAERYEILGLLGSGGMGTVYRARDLELEEDVALKVLRSDLVGAPDALERFRREVKLARRITHRNVARVFDIGEHGGEKFLTMELVDGEALTALLGRTRRLPLDRVLAIATGVCAGLEAAHAAGVVHRDLKPDNVLLAKDGRAVLTDFGIARPFLGDEGASSTIGMMVGTPAYMAPEQIEAKGVIDARADVYALGAMLFELFTGERAWPGDSPFAVAAARLVQPPPDPRARGSSVTAAEAAIVLRCMARMPADRYASVADVRRDLEALAAPSAATLASGLVAGYSSVPPQPSSVTTPSGSYSRGALEAALADVRPRAAKGVAVLPFRNLGAPADDYLAEGITDDLIDALSMTPGLRVPSRGAVGRFKGQDRDAREIGKDLGVEVVVDGGVRRLGSQLRINARVIGVADGFQLWAKRFDGSDADLFTINDEAARAIAAAVTVDAAGPAREAPADPVAIDLYLRARAEYQKFWRDHVERAIELYEQALALAPENPTILAAYAMACVRLWFFAGDEALGGRARDAAARAMAAAPHLGEAHLATATVLFHGGDVPGAMRALREAVTRAPGLAEAHATLGRVLGEIARTDDARTSLEAARAIDPRAPFVTRELARIHALLGDLPRARAELQLLREHEGDAAFYMYQSRILLWHRDRDAARAVLVELESAPPSLERAATFELAKGVAKLLVEGEVPAALEAARHASRATDGASRRRAFFAQLDAELAAFLGHRDDALAAVENSVSSGLIDLLWLDRCPLLDPLRGDPRYEAQRDKVVDRVRLILKAFAGGAAG